MKKTNVSAQEHVEEQMEEQVEEQVEELVEEHVDVDGLVPSDDENPPPEEQVMATENTKSVRRDKLILSPEDENEVALWYQQNEIFYNRHLKDYKNTQKKDRMLEEKAKTLKTLCTGKQLKTWLESMRTAYGKLKKHGPSGAEKKNPTEKESWILQNFSCCEPYIRRAPGRQAVKVCANTLYISFPYKIFGL